MDRALCGLFFLALSSSEASRHLQQQGGSPGLCQYVQSISGVDIESDQSSDSLASGEGSSISADNAPKYVRILTDADGEGEFRFFFTVPSLYTTSTSITVELSVLIASGDGANWLVDLYDWGTWDGYWNIGNLASAGTDWTTVSFTVDTTNSAAVFIEPTDPEMLMRIYSPIPAEGESGPEQLGYVDFAQILAGGTVAPPTPTPTPTDEPVTPPIQPVKVPIQPFAQPVAEPSQSNPVQQEGTPGSCFDVHKESGLAFEDDQGVISVTSNEGLSISDANRASYLRVGTDSSGEGEYELYFSVPSLFSSATSITLEFSALVDTGDGSNWLVDIYDWTSSGGFYNVGNLDSAGTDWTTVSISVATTDSAVVLIEPTEQEMLLRVYSPSQRNDGPGSPQLAYLDFAQIVAGGVVSSPVPAPISQPVTAPTQPVVAPTQPVVQPTQPVSPPTPVVPGTQQRWAAFAQFVPDWEAWKVKLGNGACDDLEECRTDSACCSSPSASVCGNGFCEEDETRDTCNEDCSHKLSICGNGVCENSDEYHVNWYENEFSCPVDCDTSPNLDVSSTSATGSCFMSDSTCEAVCGDGICSGTDTCTNCPRDCGECPPTEGDGICSYPFENASAIDCAGTSISNFIAFNGEEYATIDNAVVLDGDYIDGSCTSVPTAVPAGWRLADWDAAIAKSLVEDKLAKFDTGCLVFEEGNAVSTDSGEQGDNETGCGIIPIVQYNGNRFAIATENCASRLMIQRIKESGSETCPTCSNGGMCNTLNGKCACLGPWTGPGCNRAIGDFSVPPPSSSWYRPALGTTWEWQIDGQPIPGAGGEGSLYDVSLYDIDYSYSSSVIADLKGQGKKVMCYISAGTSEDFRDDINLFPEAAKGGIVSFGEGDTFADERWLDLRRLDLIAPIMLARLDVMAAKGCDAVEWDNADLPVHETGLPNGQISMSVQIAYNAWIAAQTHARGMGVAMKNNNEAAAFHVNDYDMVVNEECWINGNCPNYWPWIKAGKPILNTEYFTARCMYCDMAELMNISTIKKVPDLTSCRVDCKSTFSKASCDIAAVSGTVTYPIDWTIGSGGEMNTDWCPMTTNIATDECPSTRFATCDPNVGY